MTDPAGSRSAWWRSSAVLGAAVGIVVAVLAELWSIAASGTPSWPVLFLGRFHPLLVHLPIGIWVVVAIAEAGTLRPQYRKRIDPVLGLVLPLLLLFSVLAFVLGQFLAEDGYTGRALLLHRRLELAAVMGAALSLVAFSYQAARGTPGARLLYRGLLFTSLGFLSLGAHFGGAMTHGETYLSKYAPSMLKPLLGGEEPAPPPAAKPAAAKAEPLLFADVVLPMLDKYCVSCHGGEKQKGDLRLDSLAAINKGGEDGPVVVAGSAQGSRLIQVLLLPPGDDDRMPPEDKPAPSAQEIALLRFWIDRGAGEGLRVNDLLAPPDARLLLEKAAGGAQPVKGAVAAPSASPPSPSGSAGEPATPNQAAPSASPAASESAATAAPKAEAPAPEAEAAAALQPAKVAAAPQSALAILHDKCGKCHGASKQKGKLRLDSVAAMLKGGAKGPALVPGHPEKSSLVQRIRLPLSDEDHMPPKKEPQVDPTELAILTAWVRQRTVLPSAGAEVAAAETTPSTGTSAATSDEPASAAAEPAAEAAGAETAAAADQPADATSLASLPARVRLYHDAVQPILSDKCGKCHSGAAPKANLDVTSIAKLREGGWSGPGVVPGKLLDSLVWQRSTLPQDDDDRMPPAGEPPITQGELDLLARWIESGASAEVTAESSTLSPAAQSVLARTYRGAQEQASAQQVEAGAGGCAACSVGDARARSLAPFALLGAAALALVGRRYRRQSATAYPS